MYYESLLDITALVTLPEPIHLTISGQSRTPMLMMLDGPCDTTRHRMRKVEAKVGILVLVDNSIYRKYLQGSGNDPGAAMTRISQYYSMVVSMVDQRFGTISEPHLRISVRMSALVVFKTREESTWLENIVDWTTLRSHGRGSVFAEYALQKLTTWISGSNGLPEFDHAMLFTGYRLTNSEEATLGGMAYLKAICDVQSGNAISIVFDIGDFQCIKVATHELAHSLGAYHDGDRQEQHCRPDSNFIMSPLNTYSHQVMKNAFYFSTCSIQDMWQHLSSTSSSCVRDEPPVYQFHDVSRSPPGKLYNADVQCKLAFGGRSVLCKDDKVVSIMCGQLWCSDPDKPSGCRTNTYMTALPGTPCGHDMVCHLGECILDNSQNNAHRPLSSHIKVVSTIPQHVRQSVQGSDFERQDPVILSLTVRATRRSRKRKNRCTQDRNARYCDGLVRLNPSGCKRRSIRRYCCITCRRLRRKLRKHNS
ncbi:unnamed protein product [Candidula unifasciata]|uniref:Peptidase M12B domain-containing protein n=1 Tax=Candidula unifasciata TaxID=100452 RepID=A0A8S3ZIA4_9EUPU|nr:unnamed protein product [Candidula unifasciata]